MSFNKFLGTSGVSNVTDGSTNILGRTLGATNLGNNSSMKTNGSGIINTSPLLISDTAGLQTALDAKLNNPASADQDMALFDIKNLTDLEFITGDANAITFTPPAVGSVQSYTLPTILPVVNNILQSTSTGVLSWIPEAGTGDVDSSSIPSVDNRITLYDGVGGITIKEAGSATIESGVLNDDLKNIDKVECSKVKYFNDAGTQFLQVKTLDLLGSNFLEIIDPTKTVTDGFSVSSSVGNRRWTQAMRIDGSENLSGLNGLDVNGTGLVDLQTSNVSSQAIRLLAGSGGILIDSADVDIESTSASATSILLNSPNGGIDLESKGDLELDGGKVVIKSKDNSSGAISLTTLSTMSSETISIINNSGTSGSALKLQAVSGDLDVDALDISILANKTTSDASLSIATAGNVSDVLSLTAITSTSLSSINLDSVSGGILIGSGVSSASSIKLSPSSVSGGVLIESGASSNVDINTILFNTSGDISEISNIKFEEDGGLGPNELTINSPALSSSYTLKLPNSSFSALQFLQTSTGGSQASLKFSDIPLPTNFIHGCDAEWKSVTAVTVNLGDCRDDVNSFNLSLSSNTDAVITVTGAGGLQTLSSEASDTWYEVHVIGDTTGVNATNTLLIPVGTAFLESGFDVNRLVGFVRNNASSDFRQFSSYGLESCRHLVNEVEEAEISIRDGSGSATFVVQSVANFVPPLTKRIDLQVEFDMDDDAHKFFIRSGLNLFATIANTPARHGQGISSAAFEFDDFMISNVSISPTTPSFEWATSVAGNDVEIRCLGYYIEI